VTASSPLTDDLTAAHRNANFKSLIAGRFLDEMNASDVLFRPLCQIAAEGKNGAWRAWLPNLFCKGMTAPAAS
jgi:hypothetical protein